MRTFVNVFLSPQSPSSPSHCLPLRKRATFLVGLTIAIWALAAAAFATEGAFVSAHGPVQRSRAGAGVASPRDASWMILNPASLVELDRRIDFGLDTVLSDVRIKPKGLIGNTIAGEMNDSQYFFIPSAGLVWPTEHGAVGVGFYVPSGIGDDFPRSRTNISYIPRGNADRRLEFQHMRLVLTYAHQFDNGWAVGCGINGSLSRLRSDSFTLNLAPARADNEWDRAFGAGFVLGVYKRWDRWAFGASYQSRQWSERFDAYPDLLKWSLDLPPIYQVGVAYQLTPSFEVVADCRYIDCRDVKQVGVPPLDGGFGWQNMLIWKLGCEWEVNPRWTLRAGVSHGDAPVVAEHLFYNALTSAGTIKDHVAFGVSYDLTESSELHITYVRALRNSITGSRTGNLLALVSGGMEAGAGHDGITVGYSFKF
jgi:long-chain fatty acid transport protein